MRTTKGSGPWAVMAVAGLIVLTPSPAVVSGSTEPQGPASPSARVEAFSADLSLRRGVVPAGAAGLEAAVLPTTFHLERRLKSGRWTSILTVTSPTRPPFVSPGGKEESIPPVIARIEDDGDGTDVRVYGRDGLLKDVAGERDRLRAGVAGAASAPFDPGLPPDLVTSSEWIESVRPSLAQRAARRLALRRRFGAGATLGALDRFVLFRDGESVEILADRDWAVPVEINFLKAGVLDRHLTFTYAASPDGLVRRGLRSERRLDGGDHRREIVELEMANVRFEERRSR